ncbi:aspartate/glutamate racemase family protein [Candidatus Uhrbacteria bacterium]|nr:aspartate/glutamate racemase family protein [Candidatus Uhrbacteria bacterium]
MIGIFDSGIGGLGAASQIRKKAPRADLVYFGDLANMPYGPRPVHELFTLTLDAMTRLRQAGATEFVAACNSVSVAVLAPMLDLFGSSHARVIEMVGPATHALYQLSPKKVLVAATLATVRSGLYERAFGAQGIATEMIALADLASAIEREASPEELNHLILPAVKRAQEIGADTLVFGCTQYPFARAAFARAFAHAQMPMRFFDPSEAVAEQAVAVFNTDGQGKTLVLVSKPSAVFEKTVHQLFGPSVCVQTVGVENKVDNSVER